MSEPDSRPIGIFDSGIGGLTVLHAIGELLPDEELVYLGDTARVPYGTKSADTVRRYSEECARFLSGHDVKAIVVACNSASATSIETLREGFPMPVIGVIEAGVTEAMRLTEGGGIGVIGTRATVDSGRYETLLKEAGAKEITSIPCPLFVPLAEEGMTHGEIAEAVAREYLAGLPENVDTLILGCTHYPLLEETIGKVAGGKVKLVNSARAVAARLKEVLTEKWLLAPEGRGGGKRRYFVTDSPKRAEEVGSRFLGEDIAPHLEQVEI